MPPRRKSTEEALHEHTTRVDQTARKAFEEFEKHRRFLNELGADMPPLEPLPELPPPPPLPSPKKVRKKPSR